MSKIDIESPCKDKACQNDSSGKTYYIQIDDEVVYLPIDQFDEFIEKLQRAKVS